MNRRRTSSRWPGMILARLTGGVVDDLLRDVLWSPAACVGVQADAGFVEVARGRQIHDLRHTAARLWLAWGVDPVTVQAFRCKRKDEDHHRHYTAYPKDRLLIH